MQKQRSVATNSSSSRENSPIRSHDWPLPDLVDQSQRSQMVNVQADNQKEFGSYLAFKYDSYRYLYFHEIYTIEQ